MKFFQWERKSRRIIFSGQTTQLKIIVTDKDVWLLQQAIADKFQLNASELRAADMDGDGKPTMKDVVDLQRLLAKMLPGDVNGEYLSWFVTSQAANKVTITLRDEIRPLPAMHTIISDTGKVRGHSFTCCGEDWSDNDYNDFYINLVGELRKGDFYHRFLCCFYASFFFLKQSASLSFKKRFVTVTRYIFLSFPIIHTVINNSPGYTVHRQNPALQAFYCL